MRLSILSCVSGPSVYPPWRSVCSSLLPIFFIGLSVFLEWNWCEFFKYFGDQTLVQGIFGKYVFPYSWFSFHFNAVFLAMQKFFNLMRSHLVISFLSLALGDISVKMLVRGMSEIFLPMFSSRTFMVS